jgi:hypothetical protein
VRTKVSVTLDGRLLIEQGPCILEVVEPSETAALLAALAEAWLLQAQIAGVHPLRDGRDQAQGRYQ